MAGVVTNKKRRFIPRVKQCICCGCFSAENSVKICTILMMIFYIANIIKDIRDYGFFSSFIEILIYIVAMVSLVFLLKGIRNLQLEHMKQFIYVFVIFNIYLLVNYISFVRLIFNDDYFSSMVEVLKENPKADGLSEKQLKDAVKLSNILSFIYNSIYLFSSIYYYLVTASYVKDVEEHVGDECYIRDIEDAF